MALNKSSIAREFWRKIYNENAIDLRNSDARKSVVNDFLDDPMNIKEGWNKSTDKRFFRLAFDKVTREYGKTTANYGVKPEPSRVKKNTGGLNLNIKTDEKKIPEKKKSEVPDEKKNDKNPLPKDLQSKELLQQQQAIALTYTSQSVAVIFDTVFNLLHSRFPACSPLSKSESSSLGDAWYPIFNEFLSDKGGKWILPAIITAPIVLVRVSQFQRARKEQEIAETYGYDKIPDEDPKPKKKKDDSKKWSNRL